MENIEICNKIKLKDDNLNTLNNLEQYYTDRKILTYMCKKISNKDNEVLTSMFDLPCGSGKFSTMNNNENEIITNNN